MTVSKHFDLSAVWPTGSDDVAEIYLRVGDMVISRIADTQKGTLRDSFRASATSMALWLADNWWRLRWETISSFRYPSADWRLRHELNSASGGALWPALTIYSSGGRIAFAPSMGNKFVNGPQTYFPFQIGMVAANEYEHALDSFFDAVLGHCAKSEDGKALHVLLQQISTERNDPELTGWRRLEACLGFDPDAAPDDVIHALVGLESIAGEDGVEEAAHAAPGAESAQALKAAIDAAEQSTVEIDLSSAKGLLDGCAFDNNANPWESAEAAARKLRSLVGVNKNLLSHANFADILKVRWIDLKSASATARNLPYGSRLGDAGKSRVALQNPPALPAYMRRFELARQIGDAVWQNGSGFGIVSRAKSDRQKFQRAFATSLLCPFERLQQVIEVHKLRDEDIDKNIDYAARKFNVHRTVVRNQLVYKGCLPYENSNEEAKLV